MSKLINALQLLLPSSLVNRVFALYSSTLLFFVGGGLALFLGYQFQLQVEESQRSSVMLVEVVALAVQDSVVIGDYDAVHKILDQAVQSSLFAVASFIDLQGGKVRVESRSQPSGDPPTWLVNWVEQRLYDVNRNVTVGGKDYGILRLQFDARDVAANLWSLSVLALSLGLLSLVGGLVVIRVALSRWLGSLDRLRGLVEDLGTGKLNPGDAITNDAPSEIQSVVDIFNRTAVLVREREASRRDLDNQKFALDQHAIVSMTDQVGNITYANESFCQISGYPLDALLGQNHRLINSSLHPPAFFDDLWKTISEGRVWRGEICNRNRSGKLYWVNATIVPLVGEEGVADQYIAIRTDISALKEAERALMRAKEVAEQANKVKSDFLANMSHEIRTPMNGIIGMTELALDTELNAEQREYMDLVKSSADSLLHVVNDILDFSKIEAGRLDIESIEFSLERMLRETMKSLAVRAHQKNLELMLHVAPDVPDRLIGDPGRLRQVIVNLVGNAIKFTPTGEIEVVVIRLGADPEGDTTQVQLAFSVRDTGIGIAKDKFKLVFDSFSQADTSTTRQYGGTGLGLSISAQLVALMGGSITLDSELGRGSTFYFTLRLLTDSNESFARYQSSSRVAGLPVLVVDDNATNCRLLLQMLRNWKMLPTAVESGAQALVELERAATCGQPYALALLDVQMPEMDGFELAEHIRQHPLYMGATVMMLTSEGQRGHAARCRELGVASYLMKPISQSALLDAIMTALGEPLQPSVPLIPRHALRETRRKLNLLLAEDNLVNQTLAVRLLQKLGHTVTLANNGVEAVQHWQAGGFDAILMDVDMPEMNGYEATVSIRAQEQKSGGHIPIVAMTAHAMRGARETCLQYGMDAYLPKPIDTDALWRELDGLVPWQGAVVPQTIPPSKAKVVADFVAARQTMDDDLELFEEIVRLFLSDAPGHMQQIREGLARGDSRTVHHSAHTIKGMVGIFAAERAVQAASELENISVQGDLTAGATAAASELDAAMTELQIAVETYRPQNDPAWRRT